MTIGEKNMKINLTLNVLMTSHELNGKRLFMVDTVGFLDNIIIEEGIQLKFAK